MDSATSRDAGQREARAETDQLAATGGPQAVAEAARELARLLKAARRRLRPRERRTAPTALRMAFTLPETPSPAEMTIIETPFRIPRYMDHPEWRPW
jgi:hypothetical protein